MTQGTQRYTSHKPRCGKCNDATKMPFGRCDGCGDDTYRPPFGGGLCFLCATDGVPGECSAAISAAGEGEDKRHQAWPSDEEIERHDEVRDLFDEASFMGVGEFGFRHAPSRKWEPLLWKPKLRHPAPPKPEPRPIGRPRLNRSAEFIAARHLQNVKKLYGAARAAGLCARCHGLSGGKFYCPECTAARNERRRHRRRSTHHHGEIRKSA
jgi:hypothetical protein